MSYLGCSFIWLPCCLSPSPRYILLAININTIKHTSSNGCVDCKTPKTLSEWGMRDALRIREYPLNSSNPAAGDPWLQEVAEGLKVRWPTRHCWREYKDEGVCNKLKAWEISSKHQPLFIDGLGTKFEFLWIFFWNFWSSDDQKHLVYVALTGRHVWVIEPVRRHNSRQYRLLLLSENIITRSGHRVSEWTKLSRWTVPPGQTAIGTKLKLSPHKKAMQIKKKAYCMTL